MNCVQWNAGKTLVKSNVTDFIEYIQTQSITLALLQEVSNLKKLPGPGSLYLSSKCGIWVHDSLSSAQFDKLTIDCPEFSSSATLVSTSASTKILFVSFYRNPLSQYDNEAKIFFVEWLKSVINSNRNYDIVIAGDLNIHAEFLGSKETEHAGHLLQTYFHSIQSFGGALNDGSPTRTGWPGCSSKVTLGPSEDSLLCQLY
jgi:hypothetical protein